MEISFLELEDLGAMRPSFQILRRAGGPSGPLGVFGPQQDCNIKTLNFKLRKLEIRATLIAISCYLEAKFDYSYFIIFLPYSSKTLQKKIQLISSKNKAVTLIFPIQNKIKIQKNRRHAFIFARNDLRFFVQNLRTITQKKL